MNIAEILKDCKRGTKLYSPMWGEVELMKVRVDNEYYAIETRMCYDSVWWFTKEGKCSHRFNGECMLFPSKENRDWSTFNVSQKECELMPFERVLVRDDDYQVWKCDIFSHLLKREDCAYRCIGGAWNQCIPYAGNEHLVGTRNKPK